MAVDSVSFDETGKVATITTVDKLQTAEYSVSVTAKDLEVTETVSVEAEKISLIEIAGEVLPKSSATPVAYTVFNQYGEEMEVASGNLNFVLSAGSAADADPSDKIYAVNTSALDVDSNVTVTILDSVTGVSAKKTFKVAKASEVSTFALKEVVLPTTTPATVRTYENTSNTTISFEAADQFGTKLTKYGQLKDIQIVDSSSNVTFAWADKDGGTDLSKDAVLKANVGALTADETVVVTAVLPNGETSKLTLKVYDSPKAADVTIGGISNVVAAGDQDVAVDLNVVDQFGVALTADQIFAAYSANPSAFTLNSTNAGIVNNVAIDNKGKLVFDAVAKGTATITVIVNATGETANLNVTVSDARNVSKIELANAPAKKLLQGATTDVQFKLYDQYGKEISDADQAGYKVNLALTKVSGDDAAVTGTAGDQAESAVVGGTFTYTAAADKTGEYKLTAKVQNDAGTSTLSQVSTNFVVIDGTKETLTYSVSDIPVLYGGNSATYAKDVTVTATDSSSNKVAIPTSAIESVISSDTTLVAVSGNALTGINASGSDKTATVTIVLNTPTGKQTVTREVTVSGAALKAETIKLVNGSEAATTATIATASLNGYDFLDAAGYDVVVSDQFGGTTLSATNVVDFFIDKSGLTLGDDTLTIDQDTGVLAYSNGVDTTNNITGSFKVTAVTTNGKTVTYTVTVN
ncbi:autotransporter outer membrane beta-barrel domain-containing protein [Cytobacillus oceanisediminis]|uniref:hypothetical protein n=1 Tax=Cytobacillus oceanisediminis TaxID=665099 RepID=UPI0037364CEF